MSEHHEPTQPPRILAVSAGVVVLQGVLTIGFGIAEVASSAYPDPTQFDHSSKYFDEKSRPERPRWYLVDVRYVRKLKRGIPLEEIRGHANALGEDFALTRRGSRLSVMPVDAAQWKLLLSLE